MPVKHVIGWDIGGAHLKAACLQGDGSIRDLVQLPCPLWQGLEHLQHGVAQVLQRFDAADALHGVTMTGELVDLFCDRADGVRRILAVLQQEIGAAEVLVYAGDKGWLDPAGAMREPAAVASANWRAAAEWAALTLGDGIYLDIGSTTTDVVPFADGRVAGAVGGDDFQRLCSGALVYTGVVRTPAFALAARVPFEGVWLPMMAEQFATAADVYRLTGQLPEHADLHPSADNGPKTAAGSARRLARMIGRDAASARPEQWQMLAHFLAAAQRAAIVDNCRRVLSALPGAQPSTWVGAGVGRFIAPCVARQLHGQYRDFGALCPAAGDRLQSQAADCAPAVAVAQLARRSGGAGPPQLP